MTFVSIFIAEDDICKYIFSGRRHLYVNIQWFTYSHLWTEDSLYLLYGGVGILDSIVQQGGLFEPTTILTSSSFCLVSSYSQQ